VTLLQQHEMLICICWFFYCLSPYN
jgi:hypothetical protein